MGGLKEMRCEILKVSDKSKHRNGRSQRILVGVKMTEQGGELVTWALTQAARPGDTLTVLHVTSKCDLSIDEPLEWEMQKEDMLNTLSALVSYCRTHYAVPAKVAVSVQIVDDEDISKALIEEAQNMKATMVALGRFQLLSLSGRMHGVARHCVRNLSAYCNIVIVRKGKIVMRKAGLAKVQGYHTLQALLQNQREHDEDNDLSDIDMSSHAAKHDTVSEADSDAYALSVEESDVFDIEGLQASGPEGSLCGSLSDRSSSFPSLSSSEKSGHSRNSSFNSVSSSGRSVGSPNSVLERFEKVGLRKACLEKSSSYVQKFLTDAGNALYASTSRSSDDSSPDSCDQELEGLTENGKSSGSSSSEGCLEAVAEEGGTTENVEAPAKAQHSNRKFAEIEHGLRVLTDSVESDISFIQRFPLEDLRVATNNWASENVVGTGGASCVYRGQLANGQLVAVKRLQADFAGEKEFMMEMVMLTCAIQHPHLVTLLGFCSEGSQRLLVYEYMPNGNLEEALHSETRKTLNWTQRQKVALGVAHGLSFLHSFSPRSIIHRDIKASNILLNENSEPQVSDFGLAKWSAEDTDSIHSVAGTFGYMAPECFMYATFDEKTDVYSFGVVLLELISGRRPIDKRFAQQSLVQNARALQQKGAVHELVDPRLRDIHAHQLKRMIYVAFQCIKVAAEDRPTMQEVVGLLDPDSEFCMKPLLASTPSSPEQL